MSQTRPDNRVRMRAWIDSVSRSIRPSTGGYPHRMLSFWVRVIRQFIRNRGPVRAAALAYTTLLALVPLLAISLSVTTLFLPRDQAERKERLLEWIEVGIARIAPTLGLTNEDGRAQREAVAGNIVSFVERIHFKTIGAAATVGLVILVIGLLRAVEVTFNDIWGVQHGRSLGISIVYYWAVITLGPVVIVASKLANYLSFLESAAPAITGILKNSAITMLSFAVLPTVMSVVFGALYFSMPNTKVSWRAALAGGIVASVLWTLNGKLSALYNTRILTMNAIYGSLGALPLFLVGMYLTWAIVLFGAQVSCTYQCTDLQDSGNLPDRNSSPWMQEFSIGMLLSIGDRFSRGECPPSAKDLSSQFSADTPTTVDLLNRLERNSLLRSTGAPEPCFLPARPLSQIFLSDILQAIPPKQMEASQSACTNDLNGVRSALRMTAITTPKVARTISIDDLLPKWRSSESPSEDAKA